MNQSNYRLISISNEICVAVIDNIKIYQWIEISLFHYFIIHRCFERPSNSISYSKRILVVDLGYGHFRMQIKKSLFNFSQNYLQNSINKISIKYNGTDKRVLSNRNSNLYSQNTFTLFVHGVAPFAWISVHNASIICTFFSRS